MAELSASRLMEAPEEPQMNGTPCCCPLNELRYLCS